MIDENPEYKKHYEYLEFIENYMDQAFDLVYDQQEEEVLEEILNIYLQQYYLVNTDKTSEMLDFDDFFKYCSECPDWNDHFKNYL